MWVVNDPTSLEVTMVDSAHDPIPSPPSDPALHRDGSILAVPTIDISNLVQFRQQLRLSTKQSAPVDASAYATALEIDQACQQVGFFQIVGHQVPTELRAALRDVAKQFFELPDAVKASVSMDQGGRAWRGWFPVGQELTSGVPDSKEGYYFGTNLDAAHPTVQQGVPLHGPNLYPDPATIDITVTYLGESYSFGSIIELWMQHMAATADAVLVGMAMAFGLEPTWFDHWTESPIELFRIFRYHPTAALNDSTNIADDHVDRGGRVERVERGDRVDHRTDTDQANGSAPKWGVGEHTDYGLLTMLVQDHTGGLEVRVDDRWIPAPPTDDAIVCNLGDMLERVTGGRYTSTTHRVQLPQTLRYSFPYFYDPGWFVDIEPIPGLEATDRGVAKAASGRWDGANIFDISGTYGEYLTSKVSRVFPELFAAVIDDSGNLDEDSET